ncbi:MAG TPA: hypothetical protein VF070_18855 [Streptosporangiaceae bacterium]
MPRRANAATSARNDPRFDGVQPVSCGECGAAVLVAKFSPQHTSVQWSLPAMRACLEFGMLTAAGEQTALSDGCGRLRASIDAAVRDGRLPVAPP